MRVQAHQQVLGLAVQAHGGQAQQALLEQQGFDNAAAAQAVDGLFAHRMQLQVGLLGVGQGLGRGLKPGHQGTVGAAALVAPLAQGSDSLLMILLLRGAARLGVAQGGRSSCLGSGRCGLGLRQLIDGLLLRRTQCAQLGLG